MILRSGGVPTRATGESDDRLLGIYLATSKGSKIASRAQLLFTVRGTCVVYESIPSPATALLAPRVDTTFQPAT
jgi:hypothetical protein